MAAPNVLNRELRHLFLCEQVRLLLFKKVQFEPTYEFSTTGGVLTRHRLNCQPKNDLHVVVVPDWV